MIYDKIMPNCPSLGKFALLQKQERTEQNKMHPQQIINKISKLKKIKGLNKSTINNKCKILSSQLFTPCLERVD